MRVALVGWEAVLRREGSKCRGARGSAVWLQGSRRPVIGTLDPIAGNRILIAGQQRPNLAGSPAFHDRLRWSCSPQQGRSGWSDWSDIAAGYWPAICRPTPTAKNSGHSTATPSAGSVSSFSRLAERCGSGRSLCSAIASAGWSRSSPGTSWSRAASIASSATRAIWGARQRAGLGARVSVGGRRPPHRPHASAPPRPHPRRRENAAHSVRPRIRRLLRPHLAPPARDLLSQAGDADFGMARGRLVHTADNQFRLSSHTCRSQSPSGSAQLGGGCVKTPDMVVSPG